MSRTLEPTRVALSLADEAERCRAAGHYATAAELFALAGEQATTVGERLHFQMRQACCMYNLDDLDAADTIAREVAAAARADDARAPLADALALIVKARLGGDRCADTADELAEALHALNTVIDDPANYRVVHNVAETFQHCELPFTAIELYQQALTLADSTADLAYTQASLAAAHHLAMNHSFDPREARRHLHEGIYAATAALEFGHDCDAAATATALAHRSMLLALLGHNEAARDDSERALRLATELGFTDVEVIAFLGGALAAWQLGGTSFDIAEMTALTERARAIGLETYLLAVAPRAVDVLWQRGDYDLARAVLTLGSERLRVALAHERAARWEHVRVSVNLRLAEERSETDPLTGLPNRRFLSRWLPEVMTNRAPVCVALLDLDGFKPVNDAHGHDAGDHLLRELSTVLQRVCRRGDAVVRIGGDEFVVVLCETSPGDSRLVLQRLRQLISARRWRHLPDTVRVTASIGAVTVAGTRDADRVLVQADHALREAKQTGRDRIVHR
jgi:diguanylate cyclase (GGDEF)-like protein